MADFDFDRINAEYARFRDDGVTRTKAVDDVLALLDEVRRLRANADVNTGRVRALRGLLRGARDEVDRLADAIRTHRGRCESMQEAVGGPHAPQDVELWVALDQEDDR